VKVIHQELHDSGEADAILSARVGPRGKASPLRFAPLTGVLATDPHGQLVVRRVRVRVLVGPDKSREALLEAGTLLVGTHSDNDLVLRDPQVGKYHLEVALVAGGVRLRDLGSEGGTYVNGQRMNGGVVSVGAEVSVGRSVLQLLPGDLAVPVVPSDRGSFGPVLGESLPMRLLFGLLERVAPTDVPVLLEGEEGSGLTLVAKVMHASSRFAASPIMVVDFRRSPSERPSLSAIAQRPETFTLLLEHLDAALASDMTALHTLYARREEGVLDARILATTTTDLRALGEAPGSRFRPELLAHAAAVRLTVPPLRTRTDDIPLLVRQFAREICGAEPEFGPNDFDRLLGRAYPGNVRELRQLVVKALQVEAAPRTLPASGVARGRAALVMPLNIRPKPPSPKIARDRLVAYFEREWFESRLAECRNNYTEMARTLAMPRRDLLKRLKALGLTVPDR